MFTTLFVKFEIALYKLSIIKIFVLGPGRGGRGRGGPRGRGGRGGPRGGGGIGRGRGGPSRR